MQTHSIHFFLVFLAQDQPTQVPWHTPYPKRNTTSKNLPFVWGRVYLDALGVTILSTTYTGCPLR